VHPNAPEHGSLPVGAWAKRHKLKQAVRDYNWRQNSTRAPAEHGMAALKHWGILEFTRFGVVRFNAATQAVAVILSGPKPPPIPIFNVHPPDDHCHGRADRPRAVGISLEPPSGGGLRDKSCPKRAETGDDAIDVGKARRQHHLDYQEVFQRSSTAVGICRLHGCSA